MALFGVLPNLKSSSNWITVNGLECSVSMATRWHLSASFVSVSDTGVSFSLSLMHVSSVLWSVRCFIPGEGQFTGAGVYQDLLSGGPVLSDWSEVMFQGCSGNDWCLTAISERWLSVCKTALGASLIVELGIVHCVQECGF